MFSEEKVAQMAAYLLSKGGGRMAYVKLMKLLYLSDRKSLELYGFSISGDKYFSMDLGPVLSQTYSLIRDGSEMTSRGWEAWIADVDNHEVVLRREIKERDDFDELSRADIMSLDEVFSQYGSWKPFDLCRHTHQICPEWQNPHGSSIPIQIKDIFMAMGESEEIATALVRNIMEADQLQRVTEDLR